MSANRKRSEIVELSKVVGCKKKKKRRNPGIEPSIETMVLGNIDRGAISPLAVYGTDTPKIPPFRGGEIVTRVDTLGWEIDRSFATIAQ